MNEELGRIYLAETISRLRDYQRLGEGAMAQVDAAALVRTLDADSNSVAILVKHLAGNMRSRWTDFLTTDGEKPDRNREAEFELAGVPSREMILEWWRTGWSTLFSALEALTPEDLARPVTVAGKSMPAVGAIIRQVAHYAYHVGQMVQLCRHWAGPAWTTLSVPRQKPGGMPKA